MFRSGREALPDVREWLVGLPDVLQWSGGPPECPEVVERPSRKSSSSRKAFPDDHDWSGVPPECPGVV